MTDLMAAGHQGLVEWLKPPEPPGWLAMAVAFDVGTLRCRRQSRPPAPRSRKCPDPPYHSCFEANFSALLVKSIITH
jgi:hypothetical protein